MFSSQVQHWVVPTVLAIFSILSVLFFQKTIDNFLKSERKWTIGSLFLGGAMFLITLWAGMRQFGGFDHSALIDTAWRIYQGQMPYHDFPCTVPPGFFLGAWLAFKFFGPHWFSFVLLDALYGVLTFFWTCWLLKKIEGPTFLSLLLACFLQVTTTVLVAYWWYNPVTTIAAILFFLSVLCLLNANESKSALFSYLASLILLMLMKPNVAGVEIIGMTVVLFFSKKLRLKIFLLSLSGLGVFWGVLTFFKIDLCDLVATYAAVSGRAFTLHQVLQDTGTFEQAVIITLWASIFFILAVEMMQATDFTDYRQWISAVLLAVGIFGSITNGENKLCDIPLIVFAVLFLTEKKNALSKVLIGALDFLCHRVLIFIICFIVGLSLGEAIVRHRVLSIGENLFFEYQISKNSVLGSFFKGFHGSPLFVKLHGELTDLLSNEDKIRTIWFGPRMQWAYADFKIKSPINQPIWWHPGVSYSFSQEKYFVNIWKNKHFDTLVFFREDITYLPRELIEAIQENYFLVTNQGLLTVLHRKTNDTSR